MGRPSAGSSARSSPEHRLGARRRSRPARRGDRPRRASTPGPRRDRRPGRSGKTTLAEKLAAELRARGRGVIRASADAFQRPRAERYRRGELSPDGYRGDAFDREALRRELLEPLGPEGDRRARVAVFDLEADAPIFDPPVAAADDAILLLDGVFLLRPELSDLFDFRVFVAVSPDETLRRALVRDVARFGSPAGVERRYRERYLPAQEGYRGTERPENVADAVVGNEDPACPVLWLR